MNWLEVSSMLHPGQEILILIHEKPDGDAWGSGFGFGLVLERLGYKPALIRINPLISTTFSWMPGQHLIRVVPKDALVLPEGAAAVLLDCGDTERCDHPLDDIPVLLNVDHHLSNPAFGRINWVDKKAGATAQILCRNLFEAGIDLTREEATCFYYALVTDTGSFRFSNTSGETLRIASRLMDMGADLAQIREKLWENRPGKELRLLHEMLNRKIPVAGGTGVLCPLPYATIEETGIHDAETDTALEMIRGTEGVEAVMLLKEAEPGVVKLSLRSKAVLDSAAFMSRIGGGGHARAAGATMKESLEKATEKAVALLTEALEG